MIVSTIALGDGRSQRDVATRADSDAAQGEGISDVLALGGLGNAVAALLDPVKDIQRDQRFVLGFKPVKIIDL
ncbi:MAG: hypothetical protein AAFZ46_11115 [Pseudomonadota bacterium]